MSAVDPEAWRGTPVAPKGPASGRWDGAMTKAVETASAVRHLTSPNPWVGCVLIAADGSAYAGATSPPGGLHAERHALASAGASARGATLVTTLEPCDHQGRTPPCTTAIIEAGVRRVVIGMLDPDPKVSGAGEARLRAAGIEVQVGVRAVEVERQLMAYLHQRRTGRPWVVAKLAASVDGRTAAPDGTSQWITSPEARADAHGLRARCDAVLVGAGTVRADDPSLTVRELPLTDPHRPLLDMREARDEPADVPFARAAAGRLDPSRFVLGMAPAEAKVQPCIEVSGALRSVVPRLADDGVVELLVEGGANVAGELHRDGLVDEYVVYLAPWLAGGDDGLPMLAGPGASTIAEFWRGEIADARPVGPDLRITMFPAAPDSP